MEEKITINDEDKKTLKLELELDAKQAENLPNKYQAFIDLAKAIDAWRIFPRVFISVYIFLLYKVTMWFMALESPTLEQSGLVSIVVGAGAAWFGLYAGTGKKDKWKKYLF